MGQAGSGVACIIWVIEESQGHHNKNPANGADLYRMNSPKCPALLKASISPCTPAFSLILQSKLQTLQKIQDLLKLHTAGPGETGETLGYFCKDDSFEVKLVYTLSSLPPCYGLHLLGNVNLILNGISVLALFWLIIQASDICWHRLQPNHKLRTLFYLLGPTGHGTKLRNVRSRTLGKAHTCRFQAYGEQA